MPKCEICGKEFDSERGMHIHQSKVHGGIEEKGKEYKTEKTARTGKLSENIFKISTAFLVIILILMASNMYLFRPSKEEVVENSMDYIHNNLKGGENVTLVSSSTTESSFYRMDIQLRGRRLDIYVTKDGKYIFFETPTKIESP
ncbi:MAG: hypothetical protein ACLFTQ_03080 [Candidatus Aenigmatarchaeota archaeon]